MYSRYMNNSGFWEDGKKLSMPSFAARSERAAPKAEEKHDEKAGRETGGFLKNIFKDMDTGDILLIVIIVFLLMESDDMEVILALGLLLLGGL